MEVAKLKRINLLKRNGSSLKSLTMLFLICLIVIPERNYCSLGKDLSYQAFIVNYTLKKRNIGVLLYSRGCKVYKACIFPLNILVLHIQRTLANELAQMNKKNAPQPNISLFYIFDFKQQKQAPPPTLGSDRPFSLLGSKSQKVAGICQKLPDKHPKHTNIHFLGKFYPILM